MGLHNFSAGPAALPAVVIERTRAAMLDLDDSGIGVMECSHRSAPFQAVVDEARDNLRRLLGLDDDQEVLFLQGGAQSQFFMVPMNLLRGGRAAYIDTGRWSMLAAKEASRYGAVDTVWSSADRRYDGVPVAGAWDAVDPGAAYLHYTSNNTVAGSQFHYVPDAPEGVPLVCDASSDILCGPVDGTKFDLLYGGAQKNIGPSGVTLVIIRKSLLDRCDPELPTMLRYKTHVDKGSMHNTPCTLGIFVIRETTRWLAEQGGLGAMRQRNEAQAGALYDVIDGSDFWRGLVQRDSRSIMNVTFTTGNADLDTRFWKSALEAGLSGLKGHRSVGGLRASLYNAQTSEAVSALTAYMADFERLFG